MSNAPWRGASTAVALGLALAATASAQENQLAGESRLAEGVWTGTVFPPDGDVIELEYEISYGDAGLVIVLHPPPEVGAGPLTADDPLYEARTLSFSLMVGDTVMCTLYEEEDGHLEGDCVDSSGEPALMTMFPPAG